MQLEKLVRQQCDILMLGHGGRRIRGRMPGGDRYLEQLRSGDYNVKLFHRIPNNFHSNHNHSNPRIQTKTKTITRKMRRKAKTAKARRKKKKTKTRRPKKTRKKA